MTATQTLGIVDELIAQNHEGFAYPEAAEITPLLSDGQHERNYVLQSSALTVRQARRSWTMVPTADMHTIRAYASTKEEVPLVEEDGTARSVVVMDFSPTQHFVGYWDISATLIETSDPESDGS